MVQPGGLRERRDDACSGVRQGHRGQRVLRPFRERAVPCWRPDPALRAQGIAKGLLVTCVLFSSVIRARRYYSTAVVVVVVGSNLSTKRGGDRRTAFPVVVRR